jgi:hypothetical protein
MAMRRWDIADETFQSATASKMGAKDHRYIRPLE